MWIRVVWCGAQTCVGLVFPRRAPKVMSTAAALKSALVCVNASAWKTACWNLHFSTTRVLGICPLIYISLAKVLRNIWRVDRHPRTTIRVSMLISIHHRSSWPLVAISSPSAEQCFGKSSQAPSKKPLTKMDHWDNNTRKQQMSMIGTWE